MNAVLPTIRPILTSHSIDGVFDGCARKFEFLQLYDKRPPRDSGYAADVGTAIHEGIQEWFIARAEGNERKACEDRAYFRLLQFFPFASERDQFRVNFRSFGQVCLMLEQLMRSSEWDDWELVKVEGHGWAVEIPFMIRHESLGVFTIKNTGEQGILCTQGKIDIVLRHKRTHKIRTWDFKTTYLEEGLAEAEYTFSGQQIGYSSVIQSLLNEPLGEFDVNYMVAHFRDGDYPLIQAVPLEMTQDLVDDYWQSKLDRLARMKIYAEGGWFPRSNGHCHSWGNVCQFFDVCRNRDAKFIREWFDDDITMVPQEGYDYWVVLVM